MKKVVIIGPESTGKSTLCAHLASHYGTSWVPEYARQFLTEKGTSYFYDDLLYIAEKQVQTEDQYARREPSGILFVDTDMYVMKVWCEFVFGKCHQWILDQIAVRKYDLYLLCNTDLPWTQDELREYPDLQSRLELFHLYKDILINQSTAWTEIRGTAADRNSMGIDAVNNLLQ